MCTRGENMNHLGTKPFRYRLRRGMQAAACKVLRYTFMSRVYYRILMKKKLHLKNPQTFNEKLQWLKLYSYPHDAAVIQCADKYRVREYLTERGYGHCLNELIGVWDNARDIDWASLPERFAIKCNHGCAYNIICGDRATFDTAVAEKQLNRWMKEDFSLYNCEVHYRHIEPKIICEKYIETEDGFFPVDYKFFCFNGEPKFIGVFIDREVGLRRVFLDLDWKPLPYAKENGDSVALKKPECYDEMLKTVKDLCRDFTFVRVDLYAMDQKVVFGELTFTPSGALADYLTPEADLALGQMLDISKEMNKGK